MCDKETLKPCPFCRERAYLIEDYDGAYSVACSNLYCPRDLYISKFNNKDVAINVWNTLCIWLETSERNYERIAEHNRQLIDDIEKADSDYFKMKESRDEWKDAFHKAVDEFNKLSDICDKLVTMREMLTEENDELKNALESTEKSLGDYQEVCEVLIKEKGQLLNMIKTLQ